MPRHATNSWRRTPRPMPCAPAAAVVRPVAAGDDARARQRRLVHAFDRGEPERAPGGVTPPALRWLMNGAVAALLWYVLFRLVQIALGAA
ncbi:hypothetical protein [Sphingomonas adhaesiva]|uniref:hypothetical protein n=1 Tax=Sphingomonas adhaesiva TaxID=28212 RepID=UPI002FFB1B4A